MKITSVIVALVVTAAFTALGQDGVIQDVKHGAKKAGETIKDGIQTAGEKTKEAVKTVGKKTKETLDGTGEKATEPTRKTHHGSSTTSSKAKTQSTKEQTT